jgi:hypothetical protein
LRRQGCNTPASAPNGRSKRQLAQLPHSSWRSTVTHTISFRRPELRHVLSKMSVPPGEDVVAQIRHLEDLGYKVENVSPPLTGYGPPQNPRIPQLLAVD